MSQNTLKHFEGLTKSVWKFQLPVRSTVHIDMPVGSLILSAQMQGEALMLWAEVPLNAAKETRTFTVVGTGHPFPASHREYIATVQDGPLVWHIFEAVKRDGAFFGIGEGDY